MPVDWQNSGGACSSLSSPGNGGDFRETIQHTFTVFTEELPLYEVLTVSIALLLNLDIQVALSQCTASGRPMLGVAGAFGGERASWLRRSHPSAILHPGLSEPPAGRSGARH